MQFSFQFHHSARTMALNHFIPHLQRFVTRRTSLRSYLARASTASPSFRNTGAATPVAPVMSVFRALTGPTRTRPGPDPDLARIPDTSRAVGQDACIPWRPLPARVCNCMLEAIPSGRCDRARWRRWTAVHPRLPALDARHWTRPGRYRLPARPFHFRWRGAGRSVSGGHLMSVSLSSPPLLLRPPQQQPPLLRPPQQPPLTTAGQRSRDCWTTSDVIRLGMPRALSLSSALRSPPTCIYIVGQTEEVEAHGNRPDTVNGSRN